MAYYITETCIDVKDKACVEVCPVDCIHPIDGEGEPMLYIEPDECIDCGACEPECPWQAIYEEVAVPEVFTDDTPLNYKMIDDMDNFEVKEQEKTDHPSEDAIEENKKKWGLTD